LSEIKKISLRKTGEGRINVEDIENKTRLLEELTNRWKDTGEEYYLKRIRMQVETISSRITRYKEQIGSIPFEAAGLTIIGIILAFFPVIQILSLPIGIYLLFKSDWRAKISGIIMIVLILVIIIVHLVV
ncbi:MAG: hypothetical protein ACXQS8_00550, partial [Candidatus Helarchaeales archaeon]